MQIYRLYQVQICYWLLKNGNNAMHYRYFAYIALDNHSIDISKSL